MKKKTICSTISMLLILSVLLSSLFAAQATQSEPRYTGISSLSSSLTISSGDGAKCKGTAAVRSGYTVSLTVDLMQDGDVIKMWSASGSGMVSAGGTYYVKSDHVYVVTTTAVVYNADGTIIGSLSKDSLTVFY